MTVNAERANKDSHISKERVRKRSKISEEEEKG